jgi:hypothetical protein
LIEGRSASKATDLFRPSQQVGHTPVRPNGPNDDDIGESLLNGSAMRELASPSRFAFASLSPELLVSDLGRSLGFWRGLCGFSIAYERAEERFAYLATALAVLILPWRGRIRFERGGGRRSRA